MNDLQFILTHKINSIDSLINIMKDKSIKSGNQLPHKYRILSGGEPTKYVFTSLLNKHLLNSHISNSIPPLLLSPKIIKNKKMILNKMWQSIKTKDSIEITPKENNENKIKKIFKIIKHTDIEWPFNNEVLFYRNIKLKYVFGIVIPKKYLSKIKKYIPEEIKLYTSYLEAFNDLYK